MHACYYQNQKIVHIMHAVIILSRTIHILLWFTIANEYKRPPFLGHFIEDNTQKQIEQYALTQHPTKGTQE